MHKENRQEVEEKWYGTRRKATLKEDAPLLSSKEHCHICFTNKSAYPIQECKCGVRSCEACVDVRIDEKKSSIYMKVFYYFCPNCGKKLGESLV